MRGAVSYSDTELRGRECCATGNETSVKVWFGSVVGVSTGWLGGWVGGGVAGWWVGWLGRWVEKGGEEVWMGGGGEGDYIPINTLSPPERLLH